MRARPIRAAVCLACSLLGCVAVRHPASRAEFEDDAVPFKFPKVVAGIVEPEVHFVEYERVPGDLPFDSGQLANSLELTWLLRKTGYFAEVDFTRRLKSPPDVLIVAETRSPMEYGDGGLISIVTLGIVPSISSFREEVGFSVPPPSGGESVRMSFTYHGYAAWGFASLLLLLLPGWETPAPRPAHAVDDLRLLLAEKRAVFDTLARRDVP